MPGLRIATDDGHVLVADVLAGSGSPAVLLLHGLSQQRRFWSPVTRRLRARPVVTIDQRAHGDSDVPLGSDVSVLACARDAIAALDAAGLPSAVVVGHSWGAAVALRAAAAAPERVAACVLLDGGAWGPRDAGPREEVRERLRPPALGLGEDELWSLIAADAGPWWGEEAREALAPTFAPGADGRLRTRIGVDRHMAVLDGLLDYDPGPDLAALAGAGTPLTVVSCEGSGTPRDLTGLPPGAVVHRWVGAIHDVPLQWPALVAGLVDATVESVRGGARHDGGEASA